MLCKSNPKANADVQQFPMCATGHSRSSNQTSQPRSRTCEQHYPPSTLRHAAPATAWLFRHSHFPNAPLRRKSGVRRSVSTTLRAAATTALPSFPVTLTGSVRHTQVAQSALNRTAKNTPRGESRAPLNCPMPHCTQYGAARRERRGRQGRQMTRPGPQSGATESPLQHQAGTEEGGLQTAVYARKVRLADERDNPRRKGAAHDGTGRNPARTHILRGMALTAPTLSESHAIEPLLCESRCRFTAARSEPCTSDHELVCHQGRLFGASVPWHNVRRSPCQRVKQW